MVEKTWLVQALSIGISYNDFWGMNPHIIKIYIDAYKTKLEEHNFLMYLQGIYVRDALLSTVGNMFKGKGTKDFEYPKEPYSLNSEETDNSNKELTEEEKDLQVKMLFANLESMKRRFDARKQQDLKHP